jgi:hypothetical protein
VEEIFMVFFLYISGITSALLGIRLFHIQSKKVKRKNLNEIDSAKYYLTAMFVNLFVMCTSIILILFIVPLLIWEIGPKENGIVDRVVESKPISYLSSNVKDKYINKIPSKDSNVFVINTGTAKNPIFQSISANSVQISKSNIESPKYQKIYEYKMKKLKGNNLIINAVNDIYANGYIQYDQGNFVGTRIKLIIPSSTSIK